MNFAAPHLVRSIARYAAHLRARHREIRTARMIGEMPAYLRKDIGWPDAYPERRRR